MRGLGDLYQRGEVWWVAFIMAPGSTGKVAAPQTGTLLRHRLAALNTGKPGGSEKEDLTFEDLAADYIQEELITLQRDSEANPLTAHYWLCDLVEVREDVSVDSRHFRQFASAIYFQGGSASV
jgi:hypothetical protein